MSLNHATFTVPADAQASWRDVTIIQHLRLVHALARRLQQRLPASVTLDDLMSAGTIGLIQAVDRFEPGRGLQFTTYARHRIWGAMLDFLRDEDPLSRDERRGYRQASTDLPVTISLNQFADGAVSGANSVTTLKTRALENGIDVREARQSLSRRENLVIALLFDNDLSNRDVARAFGVNESRVSQIKRSALLKLRARIE